MTASNKFVSDYGIDKVGIYQLCSSSYPDSVWREYYYKFEDGTPEKFEELIQRILKEGQKQKIKELKMVLEI